MTALADDLYYKGLFDGSLTNPDGCAIRATHFVSARSNDYTLVSENDSKLFEFINLLYIMTSKILKSVDIIIIYNVF